MGTKLKQLAVVCAVATFDGIADHCGTGPASSPHHSGYELHQWVLASHDWRKCHNINLPPSHLHILTAETASSRLGPLPPQSLQQQLLHLVHGIIARFRPPTTPPRSHGDGATLAD
jgi:hypothetical protein